MNSLTATKDTDVKAVAWPEVIVQALEGVASVSLNEELAKRTTLRVGGPAAAFVEPASEAGLAAVLEFCHCRNAPWLAIGRGSNLLVADAGFNGVVISLGRAFAAVAVEGLEITAGAGAKLKGIAIEARNYAVAGFEFMEGIPGSLGGALRMNAGAMGSQMFDVVKAVRVMELDGTCRDAAPEELRPAYRHCPGLANKIVVSATLAGTSGIKEAIAEKMDAFSRKRWNSQPAAPSAGCIFKNPLSIGAGQLIQELGLKGSRCGGAMISHEHGNFFVNTGNATARDFFDLIQLAREEAWRQRGIRLETEVQILGSDTQHE